MKGKIKKVVLAYSGGLDTSVILHWLRETYACEVIAFVADLGQGEELAGLREKGLYRRSARRVCPGFHLSHVTGQCCL